VTGLARDSRPLVVAERRYTDPVVRALEADLQREYIDRYGGEDAAPTDPSDFEAPNGVFMVGFLGDEPVATGGYRRLETGIAEIKRMYVSTDHRGSGYARELLKTLESHARGSGFRRVVLEAGIEQPEALSLYGSSGYTPTEPFGFYADQETSRFYGKDL